MHPICWIGLGVVVVVGLALFIFRPRGKVDDRPSKWTPGDE